MLICIREASSAEIASGCLRDRVSTGMSSKRQATQSARKVFLPREPLTSDEEFECLQAFALFDRDEDGLITAKDLSLLIRSLEKNPTDNEIQQLVDNIIDTDLNLVDRQQFLTMMSILKKNHESNEKRELREIFDGIDTDGNGFIDGDELRVAVPALFHDNEDMKLTPEEIAAMIEQFDTDKDGRLSFDEFASIFEGQV